MNHALTLAYHCVESVLGKIAIFIPDQEIVTCVMFKEIKRGFIVHIHEYLWRDIPVEGAPNCSDRFPVVDEVHDRLFESKPAFAVRVAAIAMKSVASTHLFHFEPLEAE